jgi:hypothetical protein
VTWRAEVYKHGAIGLRRADNANLTRSYPAPSPLALRTPAQQRELALRLFEDEMHMQAICLQVRLVYSTPYERDFDAYR